ATATATIVAIALTVAAATTTASRRGNGSAVVDVQHVDNERAFRTGADFARNRRAFADIVVSRTAKDRHREERIRTAIGKSDEAEAFCRIKPFHFCLNAATRLRLI